MKMFSAYFLSNIQFANTFGLNTIARLFARNFHFLLTNTHSVFPVNAVTRARHVETDRVSAGELQETV